jgi:aminocarboxymuconate-semialdehyde decarboxylase
MTMVVDFHAHLLERSVWERCAPHNVMTGWGSRPAAPEPGSVMEDVFRKMLDPGLHLEDMDRLGIDLEVLSSSTVIQGTAWAQPADALELDRRVNDAIAEWARRHPDRITGAFTMPLQDLEIALGELERCVDELGMRVVNLPVAVRGTYLSAPQFGTLWEEIARRELVVLVHPDGATDPWYQQYSLWNSVGQPVEEAKFLASLIYEGVLERLPELKIVVSHGGGYLPHYFGRLDRNVRMHPSSAVNISEPPSAYLRRLHYDTCLYEPTMLDALVDRVGASQIVMGADYPVGEPDPVGFVRRCERLSDEEAERVLGGTAVDLLGLASAAPRGARD